MSDVQRLPSGYLSNSQEEPALSGNGEKLALIVDKNGRASVQLRDVSSGRVIPLNNLSRHQPHSSPSLSWNGRYLALIVQRGNKREVIIDDRQTGKIFQVRISGGRTPLRLSLAPDATQLAMQLADKGQWRIELFDLSQNLEPDQPSGIRSASQVTSLD